MLVVMKNDATDDQIEQVVARIHELGYEARPVPGSDRTAIGIVGNEGALDPSPFIAMPGVKEAIPVTRPYKLVSREFQSESSVIPISEDIKIGDDTFAIIAGPCAVEDEALTLDIAEKVRAAGAHMFRGGAYKPRTSPYSFQGLGEKGLKILARVREKVGLPIVSEAIDHTVYDIVEEYCDIVQIGTRNMQNFSLLRRAGRSTKPVILKRGMAATVEEWLMSAEYIVNEGNPKVILCERGIRTFCNHSRNTLDLSAVLFLLQETHLPVIVDPSHASGRREQVIPLSKAACAVGANGIMVEVHSKPEKALSDGQQSITPEEFGQLAYEVKHIANIVKELGKCL
ncbi:MAG: 3-deoxy-7-phosphoheptulonate synthase [Deltaproteobacteria bacterium]|nr:3-deoxy-7-phosphoheptulonate synthase [Deltaproteobacteria bacterium]MBW2068490.1 3-deoxy-7-phosphoheptulonate synthase [Deltaproteobacteria bacterium]